MQSQMIADLIESTHPEVAVELVIVKTTGDRVQDRPLHEIGGKGLFTKELEQSLLRGEVDFAVHSYKDVPVTQPLVPQGDLVIAAVPAREDARDVLVSEGYASLAALPEGAVVGTGSLRRQSQLQAVRPDLRIVPLRGNIDSRIRKLRDKAYDAVVLALAGVRRAGMYDASLMQVVDAETLVPAAGQGALALQCRREDVRTRQILARVEDASARRCVEAERALVALLRGDCHSPIAVWVRPVGSELELLAAVGGHGGTAPVIRTRVRRPVEQSDALAPAAFAELERQGALRMLHPV